MMRPLSIRYTGPQVALMVRIIARDSMKRLSAKTGVASAGLRAVASGRMAPTDGVLAAFDLKRDGRSFIWQILK